MSESEPERSTERDAEETLPTGASSVVAALENAGVEAAFGVQGGAIMPIYDALYQSDIEHVTMAHEQGAAHAADAYGAVTGKPGVCLATSGPGATNLVTGIADATWTRSRCWPSPGRWQPTWSATTRFRRPIRQVSRAP